MADLTLTEDAAAYPPTGERPAVLAPGVPLRRSSVHRWAVRAAAVLVALAVVVALVLLVTDQVGQRHRFDTTQTSLRLTRRQVAGVSAQLSTERRQLALVTTQVGDDTTTAAQDSSQLEGALTALAAARSHVTQQASLIVSLQKCLGGVERSLNALAVGKISRAVSALDAVSSSCSAAVAASG